MAKSRTQQDLVVTGNHSVSGAIAAGTSSDPHAKAVMDMVSTTKGMLPPRMTTVQRDAIATPPQGLTIFNTTTNKLNTYNTIAWVEVGSGSGQGGINYVSEDNGNSDFETDAAHYTEYADAAQEQPVDGSGGSPTVTITRTTSSPLRGLGSGLITKDASDRQGEGVSTRILTIAKADQAKVLTVEFEYEVSADFVVGPSSDIRIWLLPLDGSDTNLRQVTPYTIQGKGGTHRFKGYVQTTSDATQYRILFHVATTNANAWTFKFDSLYFGPDSTKVVQGAIVTDWKLYTPIFTGFGTVTSDIFSRRVGNSLEIIGRFATGTATATQARMTLGFDGIEGNVTSSSLLPADCLAGSMERNEFDNVYFNVPIIQPSIGYVTFGTTQGKYPFVEANGDEIGSTTTFGVHLTIPIEGWASTLALSNDVDNRVVFAHYNGTNGADINLTGNTDPIRWDNKIEDTHSSVVSGAGTGFKFTAPVAGMYHFTGNLYWITADSDVYVYKNGVTTSIVALSVIAASAKNNFSFRLKLNAGDYVQLVPQNSSTQSDNSSYNYIMIQKDPGAAVIAASETIACSYTTDSGQNIPDAAQTIPLFEDKSFDTHSIYNILDGKATAPVSGKFRLKASVLFDSNAVGTRQIVFSSDTSVPGNSYIRIMQSDATIQTQVIDSFIFNLRAGDKFWIEVYQNSGGALPIWAGASYSRLEIEKVGDL